MISAPPSSQGYSCAATMRDTSRFGDRMPRPYRERAVRPRHGRVMPAPTHAVQPDDVWIKKDPADSGAESGAESFRADPRERGAAIISATGLGVLADCSRWSQPKHQQQRRRRRHQFPGASSTYSYTVPPPKARHKEEPPQASARACVEEEAFGSAGAAEAEAERCGGGRRDAEEPPAEWIWAGASGRLYADGHRRDSHLQGKLSAVGG